MPKYTNTAEPEGSVPNVPPRNPAFRRAKTITAEPEGSVPKYTNTAEPEGSVPETALSRIAKLRFGFSSLARRQGETTNEES